MTRLRETIKITPQGGMSRVIEYLLDAPLDQRLDELISNTLPMSDAQIKEFYIHVKCDGCGLLAQMDVSTRVLPLGWKTVPMGELCPECVVRFE